MKKTVLSYAVICLMIPAILSAQEKIDSKPADSKPYTALSSDLFTAMLGLSPDGRTIITYQKNDDGDSICIRDSKTLKVIKQTKLPDEDFAPHSKKAVWSRNGGYFAFRKSGFDGTEQMNLSGSPIFAIGLADGKLIKLSDEKCNEPSEEMFAFTLYTDPSFMPDSKSVIYHKFSINETQIVRTDFDGKERIIAEFTDKEQSNSVIPLNDSKLLVLRNYAGSASSDILIYSITDKKEKIISELSGKGKYGDGLSSKWMIKDISADARSILILRKVFNSDGEWKNNALDLIVFNEDFSSHTVTPIGDNKKYQIVNGALSPNGRFAVYARRESPDSEKPVSVIYYDIAKKSERIVFTDETKDILTGSIASPATKLSEGLFASDRNVLVLAKGNYRLYPVE